MLPYNVFIFTIVTSFLLGIVVPSSQLLYLSFTTTFTTTMLLQFEVAAFWPKLFGVQEFPSYFRSFVPHFWVCILISRCTCPAFESVFSFASFACAICYALNSETI
jgi:hypothetical protein